MFQNIMKNFWIQEKNDNEDKTKWKDNIGNYRSHKNTRLRGTGNDVLRSEGLIRQNTRLRPDIKRPRGRLK